MLCECYVKSQVVCVKCKKYTLRHGKVVTVRRKKIISFNIRNIKKLTLKMWFIESTHHEFFPSASLFWIFFLFIFCGEISDHYHKSFFLPHFTSDGS